MDFVWKFGRGSLVDLDPGAAPYVAEIVLADPDWSDWDVAGQSYVDDAAPVLVDDFDDGATQPAPTPEPPTQTPMWQPLNGRGADAFLFLESDVTMTGSTEPVPLDDGRAGGFDMLLLCEDWANFLV